MVIWTDGPATVYVQVAARLTRRARGGCWCRLESSWVVVRPEDQANASLLAQAAARLLLSCRYHVSRCTGAERQEVAVRTKREGEWAA